MMARISARVPGSSPGARSVHARLKKLERLVDTHDRALAIQLERIAQLQADLDAIRAAWLQTKPPDAVRIPTRTSRPP
jgi:hypothetical protein